MRSKNKKIYGVLSEVVVFLVICLGLVAASETGDPVSHETIQVWQIVVVALLGILSMFDYLGITLINLKEPLVIGVLTGFVVGIPEIGLVLGALLQLVYIGIHAIGGAVAPDATVSTVVTIFLAKVLGYVDVDMAALNSLVPFAIPIGLLSMYVELLLARTGCIAYAHLNDRYIDNGELQKLGSSAFLGTLQWGLSKAIPILIFGFLGATPAAVEGIRAFVENAAVKTVMDALGVVGALMPAVGLGYLMKLMLDRRTAPWFIIGFGLVAYLKLPILGVTILVVGIILIIYRDLVEKFATASKESTVGESVHILEKKDVSRALWKSIFCCQWAWNYERMQGQAYSYIMNHVEPKLRSTKEDVTRWMKLHSEFFNTHQEFIPFIVGLDISMEERGAEEDTIRSLKTSLMGPFAGLGDSLFWFTWRPIAFGLGASLALTAGYIGPVVAVILWAAVVFIVAWRLFYTGYRYGDSAFALFQNVGIDTIRGVASSLAMAVIGALGVTYIPIYTPIQISMGGGVFVLQDALDMIMPKLLPLLSLIGVYVLYRKGYSIVKVLGIIFVVGLVLGLVGFLGVVA